MYARCKSDDLILINRSCQMMASIADEFGQKPWINSRIEDAWRNVGERRLTADSELLISTATGFVSECSMPLAPFTHA